MSARLELDGVATDPDARLANLARAYTADVENPEQDMVLWLLANLEHARAALRNISERGESLADRAIAAAALDLVGE
jgi:hypothetical protein